MHVSESLKQLIATSNISAYALSKLLGHENNYITGIINRKRDIQVSTLAKIAATCGYSVCLVPKENVSDSMIVITSD